MRNHDCDARYISELYEEVNIGQAPEPPDRTRVSFDAYVDGLVVRYGLTWWFVPCLVMAFEQDFGLIVVCIGGRQAGPWGAGKA